jgi:curli biogenesis system outer membrane secretion channel CsgG
MFDSCRASLYITYMAVEGGTIESRSRRSVWIAVLPALFALAGCTTEITFVRIREPLQKERIRNVKVVAVLPFRNRSRERGAGDIVSSAVMTGIQDGFKLVDRKNVEAIVREREFNASDLVDRGTRQKIGLTGADTAIVGEVSKYDYTEQQGTELVEKMFYEPQTYYHNGQRRIRHVVKTRMVPKPYRRVTASAALTIQMIDLSNSTVLVSHTVNVSRSDRGGGASRRGINQVRSGNELLAGLAAGAVHGFVSKVVRTKVVERRRLDKYWGKGVAAAENGDWSIASYYFWRCYWHNKNSAKEMNNIAVCIEATAGSRILNLRKAVEYYQKALTLDYNDVYSTNLRRAKAVLNEALRHANVTEP